ncbi:hypothetical protein NLX83_20355 [Allokutzneria sp. A3M-2-11 16]|uniref:hypothetical protein n=1 Tax=Allokutzneria sp. A3M-2-11 16 TaxID=2962043 RepID=UPI0020B6DC73|nr:hypothetical protein [Allokutzneria sp. A3M-2-11 16]MCP3801617.1 hypothetical protein [Allokutzneria sp. A3M-2-11 16]
MTLLELRYRRMLRVLPRWYRAEREEEMVSAFLEDVNRDPDADVRHDFGWPGWGEFGSLLALSVRTRWPGRTGSPRALVKGQVVRLVALIGLLLGVASSLNHWLSRVVPELYYIHYVTIDGVTGPIQPPWDLRSVLTAAMDGTTVLTFLALLLGARRVAKVGALLSLLLLTVSTVDVVASLSSPPGSLLASYVVEAFMLLCALVAFHSDTPPVRARWWLVALVGFVAAFVSLSWTMWLGFHVYVPLAAVAYLVAHYRRLWRAPVAWLRAVAVICGLLAFEKSVRLAEILPDAYRAPSWIAFEVSEFVALVVLGLWLRAQAAKVLPPETRSPLSVAG